MTVAPLLTANFPHISDWSTEPPLTSNKSSSPVIKQSNTASQNPVAPINHQQQPFFSCLPVLLGLTVGVLLGGITLSAVVTLWLTTPATTTTTTALPIVTALWSFNNNTNDQYNVYNGVGINTPTYVTGYTNVTNTALYFNGASFQYVKIASPFLDLTYRSFTVEIWSYPTLLSSKDFGLFSQCQIPSMDLCLMYTTRNYYAYLGFESDDLSGVTALSTNNRYHVAFVYDNSTSTQSIYLNGMLESSRSSNAYKGNAGPILIGAIDNGTRYFYTGNIDQVSFVTRAKTASEILDDATLVCYYTFDSNSYTDSGPLGLNGSGINTAAALENGRINDAISFVSASSYFVIGGLYKLGVDGQSYSIALWIKPSSVNGGTIAHISRCSYACVNWCVPFIGLTSGGQIAIQSWNIALISGSHLVALTGPILSINVWTHVVQTYSSSNGMRLYVNGLLTNQSYSFTYSSGHASFYIYLGSYPLPACIGGNTISTGQYYGLVDELRIFSREITATEVYTFANP